MKSWVMMFIKTKKKLFPQINLKCLAFWFFTVFFKLRGEDCSQKCYYLSLKSMKSLSERGKHSPCCRHTSGKLVPYLLLKVKLAGASSSLTLANSSCRR